MNARQLSWKTLTGIAALVAGLSLVPRESEAVLTRDQARPIIYQAAVDELGAATMSKQVIGYPSADDWFILDVYVDDHIALYPLVVPNVGVDYMATSGSEPENRLPLKLSWDGTSWAEYTNLPGTDYPDSVYAQSARFFRGLKSTTAVEEDVPSIATMLQNTPNPFTRETAIEYTLQKPAQVEIDVFDTQGRKVQTLVNEYLPAGSHQAQWDARDRQGNLVSTGLYFCLLKTDEARAMKKMLLVK